MSNQIFKAPGFFGREIDLTATSVEPTGIPAGVIGASEKGPAFIPTTIGSFDDFRARFGDLNPDFVATYGVDKFLENRSALTFTRVLGAGANETSTDIDTTRTQGTVKNAGFKLSVDEIPGFGPLPTAGGLKFIVAKHRVNANEAFGFPMFSNNDSIFTSSSVDDTYLVRAALITADASFVQISYVENTDSLLTGSVTDQSFGFTTLITTTDVNSDGVFKITYFLFSRGTTIEKIVSLDPESEFYISKVLNTDPSKFGEEGILLYADYAVDSSIAQVVPSGSMQVSGSVSGSLLFRPGANVSLMSGTLNTSTTSGDTALTFREMFGRFDTRFTTPETSWFISQPYGTTEYNLFKVESRDDGAYANSKYKISILGLQKSANPRYDYGTFSLIVRDFNDTDVEPIILEQFNNLTLDPESNNYIAKVIGNKKAYFNFDVENEDDRRIVVEGKYPNLSKLIRVTINPELEVGNSIPKSALPFGFRGQPVIKTNPLLRDSLGSEAYSSSGSLVVSGPLSASIRLGTHKIVSGSNGVSGSWIPLDQDPGLYGAIIPPIPMRFKVTRGNVSTAGGLIGAPGSTEVVDGRYYWGTKFEKTENVLNANVSMRPNRLVESVNRFSGIAKLDALVTGSATDAFNNNKFTLARVALGNYYDSTLGQISSSADTHMREAAYIRNGQPNGTDYTITDNFTNRVTFATLFHKGANSAVFNRFSPYAKFTTSMHGGFDGTNILDKNAATLNDRSTSTETRAIADHVSLYGNVNSSFRSPGLILNVNGLGITNNSVYSYRRAIDIITDSITSNINLLAIPGQRDPLVTEYASDKVRDFGLALYIQDIPSYTGYSQRIFDGDVRNGAELYPQYTTGPIAENIYVDVDKTADAFESRALDNEFTAAYFPNIVIDDSRANKKVTVPASIAALAALGFNDKVAFPWFAPAGFNRASLDFVSKTQTRISQPNRERLFSVKINPIVKFPREGYVIFAQDTLKQDASALQSINVQRMLTDVKRQVIEIGNRTIWNQITPQLQTGLVNDITNALSVVQVRKGIEKFKVISDNTNNTTADREQNKMNVRILLVPTRSIEFIAIDFILSNSGVQFV